MLKLISSYLAGMKSTLASLFLISLLFIHPFKTEAQGAEDMLQSLQKLGTSASVLYIAAHPDDENTRLLSYLSNELHLRTAYLSLTRGDGGQNLIGSETEEALGLIRTQELLAARRIDGAEQYFTRAFDFGYSKNPEETFRIWNRDSILHDVVWVIRNFRPDVIITRFPTTGEGGHGHHTASAMLAVEAFAVAADPKRFEHQLAYCETWQAKRLYWNNFMPSRDEKIDTRNMLKLDVGAYSPELGLSMGEIASLSRSQHKSQGFGVKKQRGEIVEYFTHLAGDSAKMNVLENTPDRWKLDKVSIQIKNRIDLIMKSFDEKNPQNSISDLVELAGQLKQHDKNPFYKAKLKIVEDLIYNAAGLFTDFTAPGFEYVPGDSVSATLASIKRSNSEVTIRVKSIASVMNLKLPDSLSSLTYNKLREQKLEFVINPSANLSNPYWLEKKHDEGRFNHPNFLLTGKPESEAVLYVDVEFQVANYAFTKRVPLQYKWVDPVKGELLRRVEIVPAIRAVVNLPVAVDAGGETISIELQVEKVKNSVKGSISIDPSCLDGLLVEPASVNVNDLPAKGKSIRFTVQMKPSRALRLGFSRELYFLFADSGNGTMQRLQTTRRIVYDHIPTLTYHEECKTRYVSAPMKREVKQIGYIEGAGDEVAEALKGAGYSLRILGDEEIRNLKPGQFDALVVGIRALNSVEHMAEWMPYLLNYTEAGGTLVMQYNTRNWISDVKVQPGPYPFEISRNRVTNEHSDVTIRSSDHPLMQFPNPVQKSDFDGWVQERGVYFVEKEDKRYANLLGMADEGEKELGGSLIYAPYGKGHYVYTGLAFFRQLPAGVPGAFRLFANLLAIGKYEQP
jgi:LmbE family N-acetylglucosaminyl deacetylase